MQMRMSSMDRVILSLCDGTGAWSWPYAEAGYEVMAVDIESGQDVRLLEAAKLPGAIRGIIAAPPCTHLAKMGARWWKEKGDAALLEGLSIVDACLRLVVMTKPMWWALENPEGRLRRYLGPPALSFDPCDYGDAYRKKTLLWGDFNTELRRRPVEPEVGCWTKKIRAGADRSRVRSITPAGFARAFFEANP